MDKISAIPVEAELKSRPGEKKVWSYKYENEIYLISDEGYDERGNFNYCIESPDEVIYCFNEVTTPASYFIKKIHEGDENIVKHIDKYRNSIYD